MNSDEHDTFKRAEEDALTHAAEDAAQVAAFGKANYESANKYLDETMPESGRSEPWSELDDRVQTAWVKGAQAVLKEAQRVGWMFPV